MKPWEKTDIILDDGSEATASTPVIVSASRSTDIPAFYADWFMDRLRRGYCAWTNPFNGVKSYVSFKRTRLVVFWSKNPLPLTRHLDELAARGINWYLQYTLNDYVGEGFERGVPSLEARIDTFRSIVDRTERGRLVWRFDPLLFTDRTPVEALLEKVDRVAESLQGYADKLVFSFADIATYRKVGANLTKAGVAWREWAEDTMLQAAEGIAEIARANGMVAATCAEKINLSALGIDHNRCIDDWLIGRLFSHDAVLMDFLGIKVEGPDLFNSEPRLSFTRDNRDRGQRAACGCIQAKDIGQYNSCPHQCLYCYANTSPEAAAANYRRHLSHPGADTITAL